MREPVITTAVGVVAADRVLCQRLGRAGHAAQQRDSASRQRIQFEFYCH
jgi:hypothetical protein